MLHIVHQIQDRFPRHANAIMIGAVIVVVLALVAGIALALSN